MRRHSNRGGVDGRRLRALRGLRKLAAETADARKLQKMERDIETLTRRTAHLIDDTKAAYLKA